jgi:hypothetical protein
MASKAKKAAKPELKSLTEWAKFGVARVRLSKWAIPEDYLRMDLFPDGKQGPWLHLFSPSQPRINQPTPQDILFMEFDPNAPEWERYTGPKNAKDDWA